MLQIHYFDFWSKNFGKREKFIIVLKQNNGEPSVIVGRILHICKTGVVPTFGCCCSWFSITISAIAYNVNNNLDEVFLAIVCTVYYGNIINRSRLAPKVAVTRAFVALGSRALVEETSWIACCRSVPTLLHLSLKIVVFSKIQYIYIGTLGSSVSFSLVSAFKTPSKNLIHGVEAYVSLDRNSSKIFKF